MGTRSLSGGKVTVKLAGTLTNLLDDGSSGPSVNHPNLNYAKTLLNGVQTTQANRSWQTSGTLRIGQQIVLDLYGMVGVDIGAGDGKDGLGQDILFENIVAVCVVNDNVAGAVGELEVLPDDDEGWAPIGSHLAGYGALKAQGLLLKVQPEEGGFDVIDGNQHRLLLRASGGTVAYSVYLMARHDDNESSSSASSSSSVSSASSSSSSVSTSSSSISATSMSSSSSSPISI